MELAVVVARRTSDLERPSGASRWEISSARRPAARDPRDAIDEPVALTLRQHIELAVMPAPIREQVRDSVVVTAMSSTIAT